MRFNALEICRNPLFRLFLRIASVRLLLDETYFRRKIELAFINAFAAVTVLGKDCICSDIVLLRGLKFSKKKAILPIGWLIDEDRGFRNMQAPEQLLHLRARRFL